MKALRTIPALIGLTIAPSAYARDIPGIYVESGSTTYRMESCFLDHAELVKNANEYLNSLRGVHTATEAQVGEGKAIRMKIDVDLRYPEDENGERVGDQCFASISVQLYTMARVADPVTKESLLAPLVYCRESQMARMLHIGENRRGPIRVWEVVMENTRTCLNKYLNAFG